MKFMNTNTSLPLRLVDLVPASINLVLTSRARRTLTKLLDSKYPGSLMLNHHQVDTTLFPKDDVYFKWVDSTARVRASLKSDWYFIAGVEGLYDLLEASKKFRLAFPEKKPTFGVPSKLIQSVLDAWREVDPQGLAATISNIAGGELTLTDCGQEHLSFTDTWIAICKLEGLNPLSPGVLPFVYQIDDVVEFPFGISYRAKNGSSPSLDWLHAVLTKKEYGEDELPISAGYMNAEGKTKSITYDVELLDIHEVQERLSDCKDPEWLTQEFVRTNLERTTPAESGYLNRHRDTNY